MRSSRLRDTNSTGRNPSSVLTTISSGPSSSNTIQTPSSSFTKASDQTNGTRTSFAMCSAPIQLRGGGLGACGVRSLAITHVFHSNLLEYNFFSIMIINPQSLLESQDPCGAIVQADSNPQPTISEPGETFSYFKPPQTSPGFAHALGPSTWHHPFSVRTV